MASNLFTDFYGAIKSKLGERKMYNKYVDKLMEGYQSKNYDINRARAKKMVYAGKLKEAKKFIDEKKKEFQELNYDKSGKPISYDAYGNRN